MKYAVEARVFPDGLIVAKVRAAREDETDAHIDGEGVELWIDVFDTRREAEAFARQYRR